MHRIGSPQPFSAPASIPGPVDYKLPTQNNFTGGTVTTTEPVSRYATSLATSIYHPDVAESPYRSSVRTDFHDGKLVPASNANIVTAPEGRLPSGDENEDGK